MKVRAPSGVGFVSENSQNRPDRRSNGSQEVGGGHAFATRISTGGRGQFLGMENHWYSGCLVHRNLSGRKVRRIVVISLAFFFTIPSATHVTSTFVTVCV